MHADNQSPDAAIVVVPYDPVWRKQFEVERQLLSELLGPWLVGQIEHVGSTAVPSLAAKPVIDIMAPVKTLQDSYATIEHLKVLDYCYADYKSDVMHWFCKPSPQVRTHHLHLVPIDSMLWAERIAFRDALKADNHLAGEYAALKLRLAEQFHDDREAYTEAKAPFVARVLSALKDAAQPEN